MFLNTIKKYVFEGEIMRIDKFKYSRFLANVNNFLENSQDSYLLPEMKSAKMNLLKYIEREQEMIDLMEQRKLFYDFYMENKDRDPNSSGQMYRKYKEVQEKLQKLQEEME